MDAQVRCGGSLVCAKWVVLVSLLALAAAGARAQPPERVTARLVGEVAAGLDEASPEVQRFSLAVLHAFALAETPDAVESAALQLLEAGVAEKAEELAAGGAGEVRRAASELLATIERNLGLERMAAAPAIALREVGSSLDLALDEPVEWLALAAPGAERSYELDFGFADDSLAAGPCRWRVAVLALDDRSLLAAGDVTVGEVYPVREEGAVGVRLSRQPDCEETESAPRMAVVLRQRSTALTAGSSPAEAPTLAAGRPYFVALEDAGGAAWFRVAGEPGGFQVVECSRLSPGFDSVLALHDAAGGAPLREDDDGGSYPLGSRLVWRAGAEPRLVALTTLREAGSCEVEVTALGELRAVEGEVAGELAPGAVGYHLVAMEPGYRYSLASSGDFDGMLTLLAPEGEVLASNDDHEGRDPLVSWVAREGGQYLVEVAAYEGAGAYRLRIEREEVGELILASAGPVALTPGGELPGFLEPEETQVLTFAATAGNRYVVDAHGAGDFDSVLALYDEAGVELQSNDDHEGGRDARIDWIAPADGTYRLELRDYGGLGGDYTVSLRELPAPSPVSVAAVRERAGEVAVGGEVAGSLAGGEPQWLRFAAAAGRAYRVEAHADPLDARLWLYSEPTGDQLLAWNDDREEGDWDPRVEWWSESDATAYVMLDERDGGAGGFRLAVEEIEPSEALREAARRRPFDGLAIGDRVRLGRHRSIDGNENWDPGMEPYVGQAAAIRELVGQESDTGAWVVRVDVDGGEWVWRTESLEPVEVDGAARK